MDVPGLDAGINPGMALTPFPSSIVLDEIRTHNLPIVSQVRYELDRTFALLVFFLRGRPKPELRAFV